MTQTLLVTSRLIVLTVLPFLLLGTLRADIVVLSNGDRLTGEVKRLQNGKLSFETSYAGTIQIGWEQVEVLITDGRFEVETETGRQYRGSIREAQEGLEIVEEDTSAEVTPAVIVSLLPMSDGGPPSFWQRLNGAADVGYSFSRGNSRLNQSSLGLRGDYRQQTYKLQGGVTSLFSEQDDSEPTSRQTADLRYDRFLSPQAFAFGLTSFERNDRQRLNLRSRLGGGFGWKLIKNRETEFSLLGGFTYINEQFQEDPDADEPPRRSSGEALAGFELNTQKFSWARIITKLSFLPNLVDGGRYRIEYDSTLRIPLIRGFTWSLSLFDRFDSDPPLEVQRNDYGLVSAFGYSF